MRRRNAAPRPGYVELRPYRREEPRGEWLFLALVALVLFLAAGAVLVLVELVRGVILGG